MSRNHRHLVGALAVVTLALNACGSGSELEELREQGEDLEAQLGSTSLATTTSTSPTTTSSTTTTTVARSTTTRRTTTTSKAPSDPVVADTGFTNLPYGDVYWAVVMSNPNPELDMAREDQRC